MNQNNSPHFRKGELKALAATFVILLGMVGLGLFIAFVLVPYIVSSMKQN